MRKPAPWWSTLFCLLCVPQLGNAEDVNVPRFESEIRPIFREFCFDCHGATTEMEANLDLRLVRFLKRGGDSGPAIDLDNASASLLLERLKSGEMPPGEARVPAEKIAILERWIQGGALTHRPEPEEIGDGVPLSVEERSYWAYQPITPPAIPEMKEERVRTPIDALILAAMPEGLSFSEDADRLTLIKRVYFDLTGLPPAPDELKHWLETTDADWYDKLLTAVLASPHYGERWSRHWLDVAGYADSEGFTNKDATRPWVWKYRDYVIHSLNADKPFDRFVTEQLAGDELAGPKQGDWTAEQIELLTATGFLRLAADGTGSGDNSPEARNKVIADTMKIVGNSLMGMSLNCAQCHDHRYDPISHADYFAVRSVFEPALDWKQWKTPPQRLVSLYTQADREAAAKIEAEVKKIAAEKSVKQKEYMQQALEKELLKYDEPLRQQLKSAYETAVKERTPEQKQLLDKNPSVKITPGVLYQYLPKAAEELKGFDKKIAEIRKQKPPEEFLRVLTEPANHAVVTKLFHRGDHNQPKQEIEPGPVAVVMPEGKAEPFPRDNPELPTSGRRLAFAHWLSSKENPLMARTIVNRVWMHHFGVGLVPTAGDFGKLGGEPSHPELLDWLAASFVEEGWSLKKLHRVILSSTTWRQSTFRDPAKNELDQENRFYWRKSLQRLDAEIVRDRMLAASGSLSAEIGGAPAAIKEDETGQVVVDGSQSRRSLYVQVRRSQPVAMLQMFDAPVMEVNCESRSSSTVATQSLMLLNGEFILDQAGKLADRAMKDAPPLTADRLAALPKIPDSASSWSYGYGMYDETTKRTIFTPYPVWGDNRWQGGEKVPDPVIGWSFVNSTGGHPGKPDKGSIRRWTAKSAGEFKITGKLSHGSPNGDGVRGRIVSSVQGLLGEWNVLNGSKPTPVKVHTVTAGETIDFVLDCLANENSDSFTWTSEVAFTPEEGTPQTFDSKAQFHGPLPDGRDLPAQIQQAWEFALCRKPEQSELNLAVSFAAQQIASFETTPQGVPEGSTAHRQALVNLCQMLLTSNEFLYID
ncbi:DUF1553 domain-containing protein [Thalassoglobus polymorphus]|uniref:Planctomycete cytochrome C n=1 Tax=Thalassoglobus polymorphus TaxID=2527994 RepID=A0A517QGT0_9PLAN|nr:DUF1553 domain-containing protein [Thalassoglobus polymorphus]QDT30815.1 Planctomycete cytochrome C [Thalassoglobus polymorphus]